ncbi:hypothetical protein D3C86_1975710 [compost metagenome]
MMLCDDSWIITYHEYAAYWESSDISTFRDTRLLQQMQASTTAANKDEFSRMALNTATVNIAYFQFPRAFVSTSQIINAVFVFDIDIFGL